MSCKRELPLKFSGDNLPGSEYGDSRGQKCLDGVFAQYIFTFYN